MTYFFNPFAVSAERGTPPPPTPTPAPTLRAFNAISSGAVTNSTGTLTLPEAATVDDVIVVIPVISGASTVYTLSGAGVTWQQLFRLTNPPRLACYIGRNPTPGTTTINWSANAGVNHTHLTMLWRNVGQPTYELYDTSGTTPPTMSTPTIAAAPNQAVIGLVAAYSRDVARTWTFQWSDAQPGTVLADIGVANARTVVASYIVPQTQGNVSLTVTATPPMSGLGTDWPGAAILALPGVTS